jgi:hypothetical protein
VKRYKDLYNPQEEISSGPCRVRMLEHEREKHKVKTLNLRKEITIQTCQETFLGGLWST